MARTSGESKAVGIVLIVIVGLLNFHIPHFVLEHNALNFASSALEIVYLANLVGAVIAAVAIGRNQESVGLPGLPKNWFEPSRIVAVVVDGLFVVAAVRSAASWRASREQARL